MLQCGVVCCSVLSALQCVAVCCSVLQCVAVCCSVLQYPSRRQKGPGDTYLILLGCKKKICKNLIHVCDVTQLYIPDMTHMNEPKREYARDSCIAYGVGTISRLFKIIGLFCKRAL